MSQSGVWRGCGVAIDGGLLEKSVGDYTTLALEQGNRVGCLMFSTIAILRSCPAVLKWKLDML